MAERKRDVFTGDDFLAEYKRISESPSPQPQSSAPPGSSRDLTKKVIAALLNGPKPFDGLQSMTGIDFLELSDIVTRLQKLSAVTVWGTGPGQTIELTDHGRDIAGVVTAAS